MQFDKFEIFYFSVFIGKRCSHFFFVPSSVDLLVFVTICLIEQTKTAEFDSLCVDTYKKKSPLLTLHTLCEQQAGVTSSNRMTGFNTSPPYWLPLTPCPHRHTRSYTWCCSQPLLQHPSVINVSLCFSVSSSAFTERMSTLALPLCFLFSSLMNALTDLIHSIGAARLLPQR